MKALGLAFDRVLASPARRVVETLEEVAAELGPLESAYDERIYLASLTTLLDVVRAADDGADRLLLAGHNPGMETLALTLAPADGHPLGREIAIKYPTGSLAEIALPVTRWSEVAPGIGALTRFIRPRDLDPELGPED
jgi:phosphohistidine phosphatase